MPTSFTISAKCGNDIATAVVEIPDYTGTLTVTQVADLDVSAVIEGLSDDTTASIAWGDGASHNDIPLTDGASPATAHTYADATGNPYTVTATGDQTGAVLTAKVTVSYPDMAVTGDASNDPTVTVTVTKIAGPNATIAIDWADGSPVEGADVTNQTATATHTYAINGEYTIRAIAPETSQSTNTQAITIDGAADAE
ncbi:hypothetical protein ACWD2L_00435 [Streptomyces sp. NPDC002754]